MGKVIAEIIAIGDELISGQRLDTNSQWLSFRLSEMGIEPSFHSCVGDGMESGIQIFANAINRADIVISTGGIGPTKDDLTRDFIARIAGVELEFHQEVEDHIRSIFHSYGREMPENNRIQAMFPAGSTVISNSEGTAPGIDLKLKDSRIFAVPGVPYEMKQMWEEYIQQQILDAYSNTQAIKHHVIHCFGAGESQIEEMLDGMTDRSHQPRVGITASQSTISLRITAMAESIELCESQIESAKVSINQRLGSLVFGENGDELQQVVARMLTEAGLSLAIVDFGFGGAAAAELFAADKRRALVESRARVRSVDTSLESEADSIREQSGTKIGVAISALRKVNEGRVYDIAIASEDGIVLHTLKYAGHSGLRSSRTRKQILNQLRLYLLAMTNKSG